MISLNTSFLFNKDDACEKGQKIVGNDLLNNKVLVSKITSIINARNNVDN